MFVAAINVVWLLLVARLALLEDVIGRSRFLESLTLRDITLGGILCIGGANGFYKGTLLTY